MSLLDQCSNLQKRVDHLKDLQRSAAEIDALKKRLSEAQDMKTLVQNAVERIDVLRSSNIEISIDATDRTDPLTPLSKVIERFREKPEAASLVKSKDWSKFQELGQKWQREATNYAFRSWKEFINRKIQGQSPEQLRATLAQTEANKKALEVFRKTYRELQSLGSEFPKDATLVERVEALSERLKSASEEFDYDVHEEVKAFLFAIQQGGAPLELLTDQVLTWLHEQNSENQFQIVGSGS